MITYPNKPIKKDEEFYKIPIKKVSNKPIKNRHI
jgi:hypothetical protein